VNVSSISKYEIVKYIRSSWSYISKRGFEPKARPGVFGQNLAHAIKRLADKMNARVGIVRTHVLRLLNEGIIMFAGKRLVVVQDKAPAVVRNTKRPTLKLVENAITTDRFGKADEGISYDLSADYPDVPVWRLQAWPVCYPPLTAVS
jgi:hypothetical protein